MEKATLRHAFIRFVDLRQLKPGSVAKINWSTDYVVEFAKEMGWPSKISPGVEGMSLTGELVIGAVTLTPNGGGGEIQFNGHDATAFKAESAGEGRTELRFQMRSTDPDVAAKLQAYINEIGDKDAVLGFTFKAAGQQELPLAKAS